MVHSERTSQLASQMVLQQLMPGTWKVKPTVTLMLTPTITSRKLCGRTLQRSVVPTRTAVLRIGVYTLSAPTIPLETSLEKTKIMYSQPPLELAPVTTDTIYKM